MRLGCRVEVFAGSRVALDMPRDVLWVLDRKRGFVVDFLGHQVQEIGDLVRAFSILIGQQRIVGN